MTLYVGKGSEREQWCFLHSLWVFSHFPCYPQENWALLVLIPGWVVCVRSRALWVSPTMGVSPTATSIPTSVFNQRFEGVFPHAGALGCAVCFASQLFFPAYLHLSVGPPAPPATALLGTPAATLLRVLSAQLPVSAPPTSLDKCFFFNFLVVGLP